MTNGVKNRPHDKAKNRPQDDAENRPDIINPVCLCGVVDEAELKVLLKSKKQTAWCTRVRILGLLLLIDYICRHLKRGADLDVRRPGPPVRLKAQKEGLRDHDHRTALAALRDRDFKKGASCRVRAYQDIGSLLFRRSVLQKATPTCGRFNAETGAETRMRSRPPRATTQPQIPMAREATGGLVRDQLLLFSATNHCQGTFQERE
jgi:hypothetical protein